MIYDKIENLGEYPFLSKIKKFLDKQNGKMIKNGKYLVDENCYVVVMEYQTGEGKDFEAHREFIDVQILLRGQEYIFVQDIQSGTPLTGYDSKEDVIFYKTNSFRSYKLEEGNFLVLDVNDLHKPCVSVKEPIHVKKCVFKIRKEVA